MCLVTGRHVLPVVNALSKEFVDVKFLKVDLDEVHPYARIVELFLLHNSVKIDSAWSYEEMD